MSGIVLLSGVERADGDGARCGGQHQHRHADGDLHAAGHDAPDGDDHGADERCDPTRERDAADAGGTASDDVGVTQVSWVNDRGGSRHGDGDDELER